MCGASYWLIRTGHKKANDLDEEEEEEGKGGDQSLAFLLVLGQGKRRSIAVSLCKRQSQLAATQPL